MATILYIDDEPDLLKEVTDELQAAGFSVLSAKNGKEGLGLILKHRPDLTLCDIQMPDMDGLQLLQKIRSHQSSFPDMPFIFVTAFSSRDKMIDGLESGVDDYLTKPVDFEVLIAKIRSSLRQVERMERLKESEHVKLYTALTGVGSKTGEGGANNTGGVGEKALSIALVGNADGVNSMRDMLSGFGYEVTVFNSGNHFVEQFTTLQPGLVLAWHETADVNGVLAIKFAQAMCDEPNVPFILVWHIHPTPVPPAYRSIDAISEIMEWPCKSDELGDKIKTWVAS